MSETLIHSVPKNLQVDFGPVGVATIATFATYGAMCATRDGLAKINKIRFKRANKKALKKQKTSE